MDQMKDLFQKMMIHRFWVLSGVITAVSLGTWFWTTTQIKKQTATRKTEIEAKFSTARVVAGIENHPNPHLHSAMDARVAALTDEVLKAWEEQYQYQVNLLKWPEQFGWEFEKRVSGLKPIEVVVPFPIENEKAEKIPFLDRQRYRNFIKFDLPKLGKIVGTTWQPGGGKSVGTNDLVAWNTSDQNSIVMRRFTWPTAVPNTLEILYAQEDLWVLTALLEVVANTNGDINARYQAAI
ncbi:MAG: hypothetical protein QF805_09960, partial [Pirellulaceae bacterium]|nr:hypothetical protein [Pirellulaceae bacterium]